jgi:DNA-binding response OmpR family regulator/sugar-specific transcriptional regulator TrmB
MTYQIKQHILIVDDDESVCQTLSAILQSEGYQTTTATTAKEALEKNTQFFNIALLDIKLPDMDGIKLLERLQETTPKMIKIMITGYPSLENAVKSLNLGAGSYIMKPIDPAELLKTIKNKLEEQQQEEKLTKEKLADWIQSQARKGQLPNFQEFLEETASGLTDFKVTKSQAKIYIALIALGIASPSEIAALSKVRREEVYRIIPKLEKLGLISRKLKSPRKFSAIQPETAIQLLMETKLKIMKEEIGKLQQKQTELVFKLKTIELPLQQDNSMETITNQEQFFTKIINMTQNAQKQIDIITSLENLKYAYLNYPKNLYARLKRTKIRIITESHEPNAFTVQLMRHLEANNNYIKLKQMEKLQFNTVIVDDKEAVWGESQPRNKNTYYLWTNDPTQIAILKMSFESLWLKS